MAARTSHPSQKGFHDGHMGDDFGGIFGPTAFDPFDAQSDEHAAFGSAVPAAGHVGAPADALADIGSAFNVIDASSFAKGGTPGGGGGGGGGGSGGGATSYFSGSFDGNAGYDIWIEFKGSGWTADLQQAFKNAADYFTTIITDDVGAGGVYRGKTIDDLYVSAELKSIDGTGGILGQAGPTATWAANDLTAAGQMQFDVADAVNYAGMGLWDDIVTHEFMHVLGFGTLWNVGSHALSSGGAYTGEQALAAYQATVDPNAAFIPVETDGGAGTAGSHWDEETLSNELMTGYINSDGVPATATDNVLSEFSVMALADLGYNVAYQDYPYDGWLAA